jgi:hypothetical protein
MSEQRKVTCESCGIDLTVSSNSIDWSLRLINRQIPSCGGAVTDMMIYPSFKGDLDFCGEDCLALFFKERWEKNK